MPVEDPNAIDLMGLDEATGRVKFGICEGRPWHDTNHWLKEVEEKINAYLLYILHGQMLEDSPSYANKPVDICIFCAFDPPKEIYHNFRLLRAQLETVKIGLEVGVGPDLKGATTPIDIDADF